MFSTTYLFRLTKLIAVLAIGIMALLIVIGNTTDYFTNYAFVSHVLQMDTTFADSKLLYRSIQNTVVHHAAYVLIILLEAFMAFCCLRGSWQLYKNLRSDALTFHSAKNWSVAGIGIGVLLFFLGFQVVGGEWFAMWQSTDWNGLESAHRITTFLMATLIILHIKE